MPRLYAKPMPVGLFWRETLYAGEDNGSPSRLLITTRLIDPEFSQDPHHGAPVGEGGLQQVKRNERCKPQPLQADKISQDQTDQ